MKRALPGSECNSEVVSGNDDIRCKHAKLCSLAVSQGKVIVSIEHILILYLSKFLNHTYYNSCEYSSCSNRLLFYQACRVCVLSQYDISYMSSNDRTYSVNKPVIIRDQTKHYKAVSLVRPGICFDL